MNTPEIEALIKILSKLPGLGPRSGRRGALHLIKNKEKVLSPLLQALTTVHEKIKVCDTCGNLDTITPCNICLNAKKEAGLLCVVEDISDLWAIERSGTFTGKYHVLGGTLSALEGVGPDDLNIKPLLERIRNEQVKEVVLALNATLEGQTTCHYLNDLLKEYDLEVSRLAHGVPVGGELDYLDDGTLTAAFKARRVI